MHIFFSSFFFSINQTYEVVIGKTAFSAGKAVCDLLIFLSKRSEKGVKQSSSMMNQHFKNLESGIL